MSLATNALLNVCSPHGWEAAGLDGSGRADAYAVLHAADAPKGGEAGGGRPRTAPRWSAPRPRPGRARTRLGLGLGLGRVRARARAKARARATTRLARLLLTSEP